MSLRIWHCGESAALNSMPWLCRAICATLTETAKACPGAANVHVSTQTTTRESRMAKNDWERLVEKDDIPGISVAPNRGHGWRGFAVLVLVGGATFVLAYYWPLYRAYVALLREYQSLSAETSKFHQQLGDTVATLNHTAKECEGIKEGRQERSDSEALKARAERIERSLQIQLMKYQGQGRLSLNRENEKIRVTLAAPEMIEENGGGVTEAGRKALCAVGSEVKDSDVHILIRGLGVLPTEKRRSGWQLATVRAGNVAQHLSATCGVDSKRIEAAVSPARGAADQGAIALEITPQLQQ